MDLEYYEDEYSYPLNGKISPAAVFYGHDPWCEDTRRYWRKFNRYHTDWKNYKNPDKLKSEGYRPRRDFNNRDTIRR